MSAPKKPLDRLPKVARRLKYSAVLDDQKADAYDLAKRALQAKEQELEGSRARRAAAIRSLMPSTADADAVKAGADALRAEDEEALAPLRAAVEDAEAALDEVRVTFVFRALPRPAWKALKRKHPAKTDEDRKKWEAQGGGTNAEFSLDSIVADLLEASIVEPALSRAAIDDIVDGDDWNDSEVDMLRNNAIMAQGTYRPDPKG